MNILEQLTRQQGYTARRVRKLEVKLDQPDLVGWVNPGETWTFASATTFTIADHGGMADFTDRYQAGDFIRFKQGGAFLHFMITAVAYASPTTTITVTKHITGGGSDIANAAITDNYYSKVRSPQGCGPECGLLDLVDHDHTGDANDGGMLEGDDALKVTGGTTGHVLTVQADDTIAAALSAAAVLDYDAAAAAGLTTTTSAVMVDLNAMSVSITVARDDLVLLGFAVQVYGSVATDTLEIGLYTSGNVVVGQSRFWTTNPANAFNPIAWVHYITVIAGTHAYKVRWRRAAGTGTLSCHQRDLIAIALSR